MWTPQRAPFLDVALRAALWDELASERLAQLKALLEERESKQLPSNFQATRAPLFPIQGLVCVKSRGRCR